MALKPEVVVQLLAPRSAACCSAWSMRLASRCTVETMSRRTSSFRLDGSNAKNSSMLASPPMSTRTFKNRRFHSPASIVSVSRHAGFPSTDSCCMETSSIELGSTPPTAAASRFCLSRIEEVLWAPFVGVETTAWFDRPNRLPEAKGLAGLIHHDDVDRTVHVSDFSNCPGSWKAEGVGQKICPGVDTLRRRRGRGSGHRGVRVPSHRRGHSPRRERGWQATTTADEAAGERRPGRLQGVGCAVSHQIHSDGAARS